MDFKLYYIEGLSAIDTPRFDNLDAQENYFSNHLVTTVSNSFYPPHYKNAIRFSDDDLDFNTQVNYLSLNYNSKEYYYFISNIEYINENLIELSIDMDVIQTYMFNINFLSANLSRLSIKRWNDNDINRNYQRENLTRVDEDNIEYIPQFYSSSGEGYLDYRISYAVFEFSPSTDIALPSIGLSIDSKVIYSPLTYVILPLIMDNSLNDITLNGYDYGDELEVSATLDKSIINNILTNLCNDPNLLSIKYYRTLFKEYEVQYSGPHCIINVPKYKGNIIQLYKNGYGITFTSSYNIIIYTTFTSNYNFGFVKNTNKNVMFDKKFVPAILDENYIKFYYGERQSYTSTDLHLLHTQDLLCRYTPDLFTGNRNFKITNEEDYNDKLLTATSSNSLETFTILSNPYKEYISRNNASLQAGLLNAGVKEIFNVSSSSLGIASSNWATRENLANTLRFHPKYSSKRINYLTAQADISQTSRYGDFGIPGMSLLTEGINQGTLRDNLKRSPSSVKEGNSITSDIINKTLDINIRITTVKDIDKVAHQYEIGGYSVNEYSIGKNLFNDYNLRYYYNVIQANDINMSLNMMTSYDILERIQERFSLGLRLWNVENLDETQKFATFVYDNVEKDFIEKE